MHIYRLEDRYGENTGREIFVGRTGIVVIDSLDHPRPVHPILIIHHLAPRKKHRHTAQYDSPK